MAIAGERLASGDALIFAGSAGDDVRAAIHIRLRLVEIAGVEGREDLVAVAVGQDAGAVDIFLSARVDVQRHATRRHLVEHLLALHVLGGADSLEQRRGAKAGISMLSTGGR